MPAIFYVGDAIEMMGKLPESSVDLVLTSPPFLALRSYLPADHPDKALEGGSQSTPGEFIDWLLDVAEACNRVLAPHGSLCIELGDTYSGATGVMDKTKGNGLSPNNRYDLTDEWQSDIKRGGDGWPLAKSLSLIPESFRWAMVYGRNPHTGRQTEPWRLRNVVRWVRPNPPVGALGDKFRPATSELMVFCKSAKRYFDLDAVREPHKDPSREAYGFRVTGALAANPSRGDYEQNVGQPMGGSNPAGAPPLDWWNIPPGGFNGAHYAVFPPELCVKPVKAMSPERVCRTCGEPSRRIVGEAEYVSTRANGTGQVKPEGWRHGGGKLGGSLVNQAGPSGSDQNVTRVSPTLGFSDCGHGDYRPGMVLDPFAGSGTTLMVATGHGRDAIGIDLDERNFDLALQRVGPFMLTRGLNEGPHLVNPKWGLVRRQGRQDGQSATRGRPTNPV